MINRRLYLVSPTEIQRLLIVLYMLGSISSQDNKNNSLHFREHKTITVTRQLANKTIAVIREQ